MALKLSKRNPIRFVRPTARRAANKLSCGLSRPSSAIPQKQQRWRTLHRPSSRILAENPATRTDLSSRGTCVPPQTDSGSPGKRRTASQNAGVIRASIAPDGSERREEHVRLMQPHDRTFLSACRSRQPPLQQGQTFYKVRLELLLYPQTRICQTGPDGRGFCGRRPRPDSAQFWPEGGSFVFADFASVSFNSANIA
jgi:hypothetical protein